MAGMGRIKRLRLQQQVPPHTATAWPHCPLCGREIPPAVLEAHHLVPRSRGGEATVPLHRICHRQVHALFSEAELARHYGSVDALRRHPAMAQFIGWVQTKPALFNERVRKSHQRGQVGRRPD